MSIYGYKGFNKDLRCRGFQYEIGKTYEMEEEPILCEKGFHFCEKLTDIASYYPFIKYDVNFGSDYGLKIIGFNKSSNRYCVVEAIGDVCEEELQLDTKHATNRIRIVRELDEKEILDILNKEDPSSSLLSSWLYTTIYSLIYGG